MNRQRPILNIVTLGCSKNKVDSEHLGALLSHRYRIRHDFEGDADTVVINTCGFIGDAKEESVNTILSYALLRKQNRIRKLYVMGCLSQRYRKELEVDIHEVDGFYGVESVNSIAAALLKEDAVRGYVCDRVLSTPRHYAYLKISEGCNRHCAFCAIPLIRGDHVSVPMEELLKEARQLAKNGVKELIVIAQDLTYYGIDMDGKPHIVELVKALCEIEEIEWVRLHYGYPLGFPDALLDLMRENSKICKYIDLPLQHVSSHILKEMRRGVDRDMTIGFVNNVRKHVPDIAFRTTFIVGFPGETESDFEELCKFVSDMRFERVGVFTYSAEEGTPAFELEDNVPEEVKVQRMDRLMGIQQDISLEINAERVGRVEKVLIDRREGDYFVARSQYDSPEVDDEILIDATYDLQVGSFVHVKITQADFFDCYAQPI